MGTRRQIFWIHAIQRMFQRAISKEDVRYVLASGEVIEDYADDMTYPSRLILGWRGPRPLHVVAAYDESDQVTIVITVYEPEPNQWEADFKWRKT